MAPTTGASGLSTSGGPRLVTARRARGEPAGHPRGPHRPAGSLRPLLLPGKASCDRLADRLGQAGGGRGAVESWRTAIHDGTAPLPPTSPRCRSPRRREALPARHHRPFAATMAAAPRGPHRSGRSVPSPRISQAHLSPLVFADLALFALAPYRPLGVLTRLVQSGRRESNPHDQLGRLELCH